MTDLIPIASFNISGTAMNVIELSDLFQTGHYDGTPKSNRAHDALHTARPKRNGSGVTYRVEVDMEAAGVIWHYCHTLGTLFMGQEPQTRIDGRALLAVAERIELCCRKARWSVPTVDSGPLPPPDTTPVLWVQETPRPPEQADWKIAELPSGTRAALSNILARGVASLPIRQRTPHILDAVETLQTELRRPPRRSAQRAGQRSGAAGMS